MGNKQASNFQKRFSRGIKVTYPEKQLEGDIRRLQNLKITKAITAVLAGILKREPTPDELSGCSPLIRPKKL